MTHTPSGHTGLDLDDHLIVMPWVAHTDGGFDPRHPYVEEFWLGILGPSAVWLLRRFAAGFDSCPTGFELDRHLTAGAIGLVGEGRQSPIARTILRLTQFGLARFEGPGLLVRRNLPLLTTRQVARLPAPLRVAHREWVGGSGLLRDRQRADRVAKALLREGEWPQDVVRALTGLGLATSAASAAVARAHRQLLAQA